MQETLTLQVLCCVMLWIEMNGAMVRGLQAYYCYNSTFRIISTKLEFMSKDLGYRRIHCVALRCIMVPIIMLMLSLANTHRRAFHCNMSGHIRTTIISHL
jgi:hypothetical protein